MNSMTTGLLVILAILLIIFTGVANAAFFIFLLWIISYLINTFPGVHNSM